MRTLNGNAGGAGAKAVVVLVLVSMFTIFVLQNADVVEIKFFFWRASVSSVVLLMGSGLVGGLAGFFLGWSVFGGSPSKPAQGSEEPTARQ